MAVSVAVCEIFSIKEWCDLKNRVRDRSRSLEMAPFDRSHTSSYSPFMKMFDAGKTRMIGLPYGEKTMTIC